jgi:archaellum component FlaC
VKEMENNSEEVLRSDLLRVRITGLEYGPNDELLSEEVIRRIFIEETGIEPPQKITVYHSKDFRKEYLKGDLDSGFDGTVIHFFDSEKGINQVYTITRGSEHSEKDSKDGAPLDWIYNALGIYTGQSTNQYRHASRFNDLVTNEIKKTSGDQKLKNIGIGHSLGGNLIQMLFLMDNTRFEKVYAINDAPPSAYQLAKLDIYFRNALSREFDFKSNNFSEIYNISPAELKAFAENYYRESSQNIHHLTNEEDMLFAASDLRGFLNLGSRTILDSDADFVSIRDRIGNLSDEDLYEMQKFLVKYAPAYKAGGYNGLIKAMTGVDLVLLQELKDTWTNISITDNPVGAAEAVWETVKKFDEIAVNLKDFALQLPQLIKNLPVLLSIFTDLTSGEIDLIVDELKGMEQDVKEIQSLIASLADLTAMDGLLTLNPIEFVQKLFAIKDLFEEIDAKINQLFGRFDAIKAIIEEAKMEFGEAVEGHSLQQVSNALAKQGRRYEGGSLFIFKIGGNGQKIEVNLSSAVRIYQSGMDSYDDQEAALRRYQRAFEAVFFEDYERRKGDLLSKIHDMESNPRSYRKLLDLGSEYEVKSIHVHEQIKALPAAFSDRLDETVHHFQNQFDKGRKLISSIKTSIEKMFQEEKDIASIFDLR